MYTEMDAVTRKEELERRRTLTIKRRRIILATVLGMVVVFITFLVLYQFTDVIFGLTEDIASVPQEDNWVMFRHDMGHSGTTDTGGPAAEGTPKWTFTTGAAIHSSPAVIDGTVYIGSRDGNVYALDEETGQLKWKFKTGSWVDSSPAVADGVVYVGSNDGKLYALDAATGQQLWAYNAEYPVRSSPAIADGIIYVGADDYGVHAVDAETGARVWRYETNNLVASSPVVSHGLVIVGSVDGSLYSINAKNGRLRLRYDSRDPVVSSPVVNDDAAYFANTQGTIFAIDPTDRNWPFEHQLKKYWNALYIYGVAPKPPLDSGFLWFQWLGWGIRTTSSLTIFDNAIYLGANENMMAIGLNTQDIFWTFPTGDAVVSSPAVLDSVVYFGSQDGSLYAVDRATGEMLWSYATGDQITSSPAAADGMVFVGSHDGKVYAFD